MKFTHLEELNKVKIQTINNGSLNKLFNTFRFKSRLTRSKIKKERGHSIISLISIIFTVLMEGKRSIYAGLKSIFSESLRTPLFDMLENPNYDWKGLLYRIAKEFEKNQKENNKDKMIIIDDTKKEKTGKKVDFISWFYDHLENTYYRGFQNVMCSYFNGFQSIPLSFHLKIGNYRRIDSDNKREYEQGSKMKSIVKYAKKKKSKIVIQMIKQIMKRRFDFSYILWDSWYTYSESIKFVFNRLVKKDIHLISMVKRDGRYYYHKGEYLQENKLFYKAGRNWNKEKDSGIRYKEIIVEYLDSSGGETLADRPKLGKVKLVFIKYPNVDSYRILLSSNIGLSSLEILQKYLYRWSIESMFRNLKQYFGYDQNMTGNYSVQFADLSIRCVFYIMMAYLKEYNRDKSMGVIIFEYYREIYENTLVEYLDHFLLKRMKTMLEYAILKGIEKVSELKDNLYEIYEYLFIRPVEKISPAQYR